MEQKEIEKKFLVKHLPEDLEKYEKVRIEQGYLLTNGTPTLRIRKKAEKYILCYKLRETEHQQSASICKEVELPLTAEAYQQLKLKIEGKMIEKIRYLIPLEGKLVAELDVFDGFLKGFQCVEVEFASEEEAKDFNPPNWFGKDVTFDVRLKNAHLCRISDVVSILKIANHGEEKC